MCVATDSSSRAQESSSAWELQKKGSSAWQLKVTTDKAPVVVDVSPCGGQLEIELSKGARPLVVQVPADAQPLELAKTKCTYFRKRNELIVEWCQDALRRLERVRSTVEDVEAAVSAHIAAYLGGEVALGQARDELAQLEARIEKLQCRGVDSVEISESTEDKQAAKTLRKELTRRLEALQLQVEGCFKRMAAAAASSSSSSPAASAGVECAGAAASASGEADAEEEEDSEKSSDSGVLVEEPKNVIVVEDEDGEEVQIEEIPQGEEVETEKQSVEEEEEQEEEDWQVLSNKALSEEEVAAAAAPAAASAAADSSSTESVETARADQCEAPREAEPAAASVAAADDEAEAAEEAVEAPEESEQEQEAVEEPVEEEPEEEKKSAEEWKALGNEAVKASDHATALEHYSAGLRVEPGHAILLSNRALCLHKLERLEEALADAKQCMVLRPDFHKGFLRAAMVNKELGRCREAFEVLRRSPPHAEIEKFAAELRPLVDAEEEQRIAALSGAEKRKEEANALFKKGLVEQALIAYGEALKMCDSETCEVALAIRNNRANCYQQLSNFEGVVQETSFVLEHQPDNLKALIRRMIALEPLEKYERALEDARSVLKFVPGHDIANRMQHRLGKLVRDRQRERGL